jgi:tRNA1Val (adenine37-N6)-methyltransferase
MANTYFKFKQFTIQQAHCAMKVCTDACLFGAWVANELTANKQISHCLDIGTGTGLLSLLLAQKTTALIDAVEIDKSAFEQAKENFDQSPWSDRLTLINTDITTFDTNKKYDCVICNPPFFEGDLKSSISNKNAAKHDTTLTLQQLLQVVDKTLRQPGYFTILLPSHRVDFFIGEAAKTGLYLTKKVLVKQTPTHDYFRAMLLFTKQQKNVSNEEIIIKNEAGKYTEIFTGLLKDYYQFL